MTDAARRPGTPLAIAHRGDPHRHRENTLPAVLAAMRAGADLVEVDVALTRDGVPMLLHDPTLRRLWHVRAELAALTAVEVDRLFGPVSREAAPFLARSSSAGRRQSAPTPQRSFLARSSSARRHRLPRFEEALDASAATGVGLMIDIPAERIASAAAGAVAARDAFADHLFAGELAALRRIRRDWPAARIALSWREDRPPSADLLDELRPEFFNPHHRLVDRALVERMHAAGTAVSTWTVDRPRAMARLLDLGVDAVITNRLARLLAVLAARRSAG